jgi:hypothetical protein
MEISLRGGSLSKISYCDLVFIVDAVLITSTCCLGQLGAKRRRNCADVQIFGTIMHWHLLSLAKI